MKIFCTQFLFQFDNLRVNVIIFGHFLKKKLPMNFNNRMLKVLLFCAVAEIHILLFTTAGIVGVLIFLFLCNTFPGKLIF